MQRSRVREIQAEGTAREKALRSDFISKRNSRALMSLGSVSLGKEVHESPRNQKPDPLEPG